MRAYSNAASLDRRDPTPLVNKALALALERVDEANEETLNDILWGAVKGSHVPMPKAKTAFRTPPGRDDDD